MMGSPAPSDGSDPYEPWDPFEISSQQTQTAQPSGLGLCPFAEWDPHRAYDEDPPIYIHYSIEWKIAVNNRAIMPKDTDQDLVLEPAAHWEHFLEDKLKSVLLKKKRPLVSDDTTVVVSVTDRKTRDLEKRFDETSIDWPLIQKQLVSWGELFRAGKTLRLTLSFNYVEATTTLVRGPSQRTRASTTNQMLAERSAQLDAEESSGQPSIWRDVYNLMRCPGAPCNLGPYCWGDPDGKKRYKLNTHHLRDLIRHVEKGKELRSHSDVPEHIREQLYAEDQQRLKGHQRANSAPAANFPHINITNVLPGQPHQSPPLGSSPALAPVPDMPAIPLTINHLGIAGKRDVVMGEYFAWQEEQVQGEDQKADYRRAFDYLINEGLDLELISHDRNVADDLEVKAGVKRGIAQRSVGDIDRWVKRHKQDGALDRGE
jgi:hypothetical protein